MYETYVDLKTNTWSFKVGQKYAHMDHQVSVYKVDNHVLCYDSKLKGLSDELTLILSDTRELDRVPNTKQSTLYTIPHGPCQLLCTLP